MVVADTLNKKTTLELDKSYLSRLNERRHLSELNQEKAFTNVSRENRLNSVERENSKLLSPEKVLSLRRSSAANEPHTSQPLSSLLTADGGDDSDDDGGGLIRSSLSKTTRDFSTSDKRTVSSHTIQEQRSTNQVQETVVTNVSSSTKREHHLNGLRSSTPNQVPKAERVETTQRAVIDKASNVKGYSRVSVSSSSN